MPGHAEPPNHEANGGVLPNVIDPSPFEFSDSVRSASVRRARDFILRLKRPDTISTRSFVTPYMVRARCCASTMKRPKIRYRPIRTKGTPQSMKNAGAFD